MSNSNFSLEQYLELVSKKHHNCLVYLACNWSGHAQMYLGILNEICQTISPELKFIHQSLNQEPFDQLEFSLTAKATIFLLKDGKVKDTIVGVLPRYQIIDRIQLFNSG